MQRTLAGCSCDVASSSSEESMGADSVTFDEGFRARLPVGADVGWGLTAAIFFVFGAIENVERFQDDCENVKNVDFGGA